MIRNVLKLVAFLKRDFLSDVSYRLSFLLGFAGLFMSLAAFYFLTKMIDPNAKGLDGIRPFDWMLVGLAFQYYFSAALNSFSDKIRNEQVLGTLEAMLVSPTPTSIVIFSSAAWDFVYGGIRVIVMLLIATWIFGVHLHFNSMGALATGVLLTLLSSVGLGILSASFILYFKRGNPITFFLSGMTFFFGNVFFPVAQLPEGLQGVSDYLPVNWSVRIVRGALLQGRSFSDLDAEIVRLAVLTAVLLPLGVFCSRFAIQKAKMEGTLVQY